MSSGVEFGVRRDRLRWCCRIGLHFLRWDYLCDAYTCACRKALLGAEEIR